MLHGVERAWRAGSGDCTASVRALSGIDLALRGGEVVALAGGAGAGKTTLLLCAAGIIRPDRGEVRGSARTRAAYVCGAGPAAAWVRDVSTAVDDGARVLLLDVLDPPGLASPRAVAALAGALAASGLAVVVAARNVDELPAFATRLVTLHGGRIVGRMRPLDAFRSARVAESPGAVARQYPA